MPQNLSILEPKNIDKILRQAIQQHDDATLIRLSDFINYETFRKLCEPVYRGRADISYDQYYPLTKTLNCIINKHRHWLTSDIAVASREKIIIDIYKTTIDLPLSRDLLNLVFGYLGCR